MLFITLKVCFVVVLCVFTAETYVLNVINCANAILANKKYESPVDINLRNQIPLSADLVLAPHTYEKVEIKPENIDDGVLHITPKIPLEPKPTLKMNFLISEYELRGIHLFWGQTKLENNSVVSVTEGSEHSVSGTFYPIEVRMVYAPSQTTTLLGLSFNAIVKVHFLTVEKDTGGNVTAVFLDEIIPPTATSVNATDYVGYKGTLTTWTRTTNVFWVVSVKTAPIKLSSFQILYNAYKDLEKRKKATIQPLCGRQIYKLN